MLFPKKCTDHRKGNTNRKITQQTAQKVIDRDKVCIICKNETIEEIHHVFYGDEAQYDEGRNNSDRLVGLGKICHHALHFKGGNNYRELTKKYLGFINTEQPRP